ncbi:MAG: DUF3168 domain-containing protein [Methylocystis sp.]|uniref:DUF3168 domain-containing protein n=1 Tax=Methylocystis sp. TaxID=1911079 RepID=UPI003DA5AA2A
MSASPVIALRTAIRARLLSDAALVAMLGGPRVYEEAPQGAATPYVLFADAQMRDWSGAASRGAEHFHTIAVVTTQRGFGAALKAAQQMIDLLDEAPLSLEGHALVDLRFVSMETKRDAAGRFARVSILFRATTEYL